MASIIMFDDGGSDSGHNSITYKDATDPYDLDRRDRESRSNRASKRRRESPPSDFTLSYKGQVLGYSLLIVFSIGLLLFLFMPSGITTVTMAPGETVVIRIPELSGGRSFPVEVQDGIVYEEVQQVPDSYTPLFSQNYSYQVDNYEGDSQRFHRLLYPGSVVRVQYDFSHSVVLRILNRPLGSNLTELGELSNIHSSNISAVGVYKLEVVEAGEYSFEFTDVEDDQIHGDVTFELSLTSIEGEYELSGDMEFRSGGSYLIFRNDNRDSFLDFSYGRDQRSNLLYSIAKVVGVLTVIFILVLYRREVARVTKNRLDADMELIGIEGIGGENVETLARMGVRRVRDLRNLNEADLEDLHLNKKMRGTLIQQMHFGDSPPYIEGWKQLLMRIMGTLLNVF